MTIQNLGSKGTAIDILPNDVLASTANGSAIDLQGYEGSAAFTLSSEAMGASVTLAAKIQECATSGGTYTVVPWLAEPAPGQSISLLTLLRSTPPNS
jgi:hypothetical protein